MNAAAEPASAPFVPTESQLVVAYSVCRSIARSAAKNFYYAFLVLPPPKRQALCAVYAFMRRCDDIADEPGLLGALGRTRTSTVLAVPEPARAIAVAGLTHLSRRHPVVIAVPTNGEAERVVKKGKTTYEVVGYPGGKEVELEIAEDGTLLEKNTK